jgi:hypothetical protein
MQRFYRTSSKTYAVLSSELQEVVVGTMLGDCSGQRNNDRSNYRLQFKQSVTNQPYIDHLYELFKEFVGSSPKWYTSHDARPNRAPFSHSCTFKTYSLPCFTSIVSAFYTDGVKMLPSNLGDMLTARGVAYWFMDDGYRTDNGFYFCTECFSLAENELLRSILTNKFGLDCGVNKYGSSYRLYVHSSSRAKFVEMVRPFVLPHFDYKLGMGNRV